MNHELDKKDLENLEPEKTDGTKVMGGGFADGVNPGMDGNAPEDPIHVDIPEPPMGGGLLPEGWDPEHPYGTDGTGPVPDPLEPPSRIHWT